MTAKKWVKMFLIISLILTFLVAGFNFVIDPFGAFGDVFLKWYSYDMTNNPRVAKISYLDKNYEKYDSYIVGCSSTSSFPCEDFGKYLNAKFYNMIVYGADMLDTENFCRYMADNYTVKNLILNLYITNGETYDEEEDRLTRNMHYKTGYDSMTSYYARYLFANPRYSLAKAEALKKDTYLQQTFDVFREDNGEYDKRKRDIEPIGSMDKFLEGYPYFAEYPIEYHSLDNIDKAVESLAKIKKICEEKNINLIVVTSPVYCDYMKAFKREQVVEFYKKIAGVSDFWDFSYSSVSFEPRYFYDSTHFRGFIGKMAAARIFGNDDIYIPDDFGHLVTKENVDKYMEGFFNTGAAEGYTKSVPVLMFHHIGEGDPDNVISPKAFEETLEAIEKAGYTTVSLKMMKDYVEKGYELPEKPICLTFDDGYLSNYEIAYPLLKKHNMKAAIFIIGSSFGKDKYKNTDNDIIPHFGEKEAKEMQESGIIEIASHTYDMHQWQPYEKERARENILKFEDEDEAEYIRLLEEDIDKENEIIKNITGDNSYALAYPTGISDELSAAILKEKGIKITFVTQNGENILIKGHPQSLLCLNRYNISDKTVISMKGGIL